LSYERPRLISRTRAKEELLKNSSDKAVKQQRSVMERVRESALENNHNGLFNFILGKTVDFEFSGSGDHKRPTGIIRKD